MPSRRRSWPRCGAAALDDRVADELRRGVLTTDHDQPGFGFGLVGDDGPSTPRPAPTKRSAAPKGPAKKTALRAVPDLPPEPEVDPEVARAAAEQAKAERAARLAAQRAHRKEHAARTRTLDRRRKEALRLAKEADEAEAAALEARAIADVATAKAEAARQALEDLVPPSD